MKWMIASDIHGSAKYCGDLLRAFDREGQTDCCFWGIFCITVPVTNCPKGMRPKR